MNELQLPIDTVVGFEWQVFDAALANVFNNATLLKEGMSEDVRFTWK